MKIPAATACQERCVRSIFQRTRSYRLISKISLYKLTLERCTSESRCQGQHEINFAVTGSLRVVSVRLLCQALALTWACLHAAMVIFYRHLVRNTMCGPSHRAEFEVTNRRSFFPAMPVVGGIGRKLTIYYPDGNIISTGRQSREPLWIRMSIERVTEAGSTIMNLPVKVTHL